MYLPDVNLETIKLKLLSAKIQPMNQGVIRIFKANYKQHLVHHIIGNTGVAQKFDNIIVTALDTLYWIQSAWEAVSQETIKNTFRSARYSMDLI